MTLLTRLEHQTVATVAAEVPEQVRLVLVLYTRNGSQLYRVPEALERLDPRTPISCSA